MMSSLTPTLWWKLDEAGAPFASSGSQSGNLTVFSGSITTQQGSLNDPLAGVGLNNTATPDVLAANVGTQANTCTLVALVKPPVVASNTNLMSSDVGSLFARLIADGTLSMYDDVAGLTVSSASGTWKGGEWNLVFYRFSTTTAPSILATSQTAGGVVSVVATGSTPFDLRPTGSTAFRGSENANECIIGAMAFIPFAVSLEQAQALADTLIW